MKVGELATSVGSSYVWQAVRSPFRSADKRQQALLDTHIKNALKIVERSKELRGAFTKLVQMLSMRDDILPTEVLQVLSASQSSVPPMDYALIRKQIVSELGHPPEELFATFDEDAFAAASLGQVHKARLKSGEDVVVKVQYPGVEETVKQDLQNVKALLQTFTLIGRDVMRQKIDQSDVYRELEERLHEELDYVNEAKNIAIFQKMFRDDDEVIIPEVYPDLSSRRVLTMGHGRRLPVPDHSRPRHRAVAEGLGGDQVLPRAVAPDLRVRRAAHRPESGQLPGDLSPQAGDARLRLDPHLSRSPSARRISASAAALLARRPRHHGATASCGSTILDPGDKPEPMVEHHADHLRAGAARIAATNPRDYNSVERGMQIATIGLENRIFKDPGHRVFLFRALDGPGRLPEAVRHGDQLASRVQALRRTRCNGRRRSQRGSRVQGSKAGRGVRSESGSRIPLEP